MQTICVVIPCYNEALRLPVGEFLSFIDANPHVSLCFVNDGSADATLTVLTDAQQGREDRIQVVHLEQNRGKAEATRTGMLHSLSWSRFDYVGYLDADLATPLEELNHFMTYEPEAGRFAVICGSRLKRMGARIERNPMRHLLGRGFATLAAVVVGLPAYDTQCGAKLIRSDLAAQILDRPFVSRWLFDVEILARTIQRLGRTGAIDGILEVPLRVWTEKGKSRLRPIDFLTVPLDLLKIHLTYRVR